MIELVFFTSSRIKLEHAKYLCRNYSVRLTGFREKAFGANYNEPRIHDRKQLLELSYQDALKRWEKLNNGKGFFIIEDTSVIIDTLSDEREFPGLDIKYWMKEIDFISLDTQLKALGNNRRVTVRSDLILHLPPLWKEKEDRSYYQFTSSTRGNIIDSERKFETNAVYPWLDNKTFNKWFVPEGHQYPISMLSIDEANKSDFRASAFKAMLEYLERHQEIHANINTNSLTQINFDFDFDNKLFVICGPSCAGKTVLAEYLAEKYGYIHIEASDYMYLSYYQRHGVSSNLKISDFAQQALKEKPEIVAEQIIRSIHRFEPMPFIITGFRSPEEFNWLIKNYSGKLSVELVYINAEQETRYLRSTKRQREAEADSKSEFLLRDQQQGAMGLTKIKANYPKNIISNNKSLEHYYDSFEQRHKNGLLQVEFNLELLKQLKPLGQLEQKIIVTLAENHVNKSYFTTTEIAQLINQGADSKLISKNNVSRYFNQVFHPYYEIKLIDEKRKYRLSNTGLGIARILRRLSQN